jgi:hypothetical protein
MIFIHVSPEYFATLGMPLLAGRVFHPQDNASAPQVAIINQAAARNLFPDMNPLGMVYRELDRKGVPQGPPIEIAGVTSNERMTRPGGMVVNAIYRPLAQCSATCNEPLSYNIRYAGPLGDAAKRLNQVAIATAPQVGMEFRLRTDSFGEMMTRERLSAQVSGGMGLLTLFLAAIGIYGVMAYAAARRTREIGIRMALGAGRAQVLRMVLGESLTIVILGVALGAPLAYWTGQIIRGQLFGVTPADPLSMITSALAMIVVALAAAWLPARRAAAVDPMLALRYE